MRPARHDDRRWIEAESVSLGGPEIFSTGRLWTVTEQPAWVACMDLQPVGFLSYRLDRPACEILALKALHPRLGIGSALTLQILQLASHAGLRTVEFNTTNDNIAAQRFYRALGFEHVATCKGAVPEILRLKGLPVEPVIGQCGVEVRDILRFARTIST
ncbi:MAG: GNAT family N-acetyltransferase [Pseudomonadota bacterium]